MNIITSFLLFIIKLFFINLFFVFPYFSILFFVIIAIFVLCLHKFNISIFANSFVFKTYIRILFFVNLAFFCFVSLFSHICILIVVALQIRLLLYVNLLAFNLFISVFLNFPLIRSILSTSNFTFCVSLYTFLAYNLDVKFVFDYSIYFTLNISSCLFDYIVWSKLILVFIK